MKNKPVYSPELTSIVVKFGKELNLTKEQEDQLLSILDFAYKEGSINGQYELYNNTPKVTVDERS